MAFIPERLIRSHDRQDLLVHNLVHNLKQTIIKHPNPKISLPVNRPPFFLILQVMLRLQANHRLEQRLRKIHLLPLRQGPLRPGGHQVIHLTPVPSQQLPRNPRPRTIKAQVIQTIANDRS